MEEKAEADYLMQALIKRLGKQNKVAKALNQKPSAFHYLLHHAKVVPLKHLLAMRVLLNKLMAEEKDLPATSVKTPFVDAARLQLELLEKGKITIAMHFKSVQSVLLPSYATEEAFKPTLKFINTMVYQDPQLLKAEQAFQLPLRTAFMGLLTCSDKNGEFYWNPQDLKAAIFPHISVNFTLFLEALCACHFVQKKETRRGIYGYIPLRNTFLYEVTEIKKLKKQSKKQRN